MRGRRHGLDGVGSLSAKGRPPVLGAPRAWGAGRPVLELWPGPHLGPVPSPSEAAREAGHLLTILNQLGAWSLRFSFEEKNKIK